jgi:hypothetical protein
MEVITSRGEAHSREELLHENTNNSNKNKNNNNERKRARGIIMCLKLWKSKSAAYCDRHQSSNKKEIPLHLQRNEK